MFDRQWYGYLTSFLKEGIMTEKLELYRCEICGNIVQIMHEGADALVCCGEPMKKEVPHGIEEEKKEKHVPVYLNENEIQVGSDRIL